jgi:hypothetical protein
MRKNRPISTKELFSFFQDFTYLGDFFGRKKGRMTFEEAGRRGVLRTSATHGEKFYSEIGRKGVRIGGLKGGQRVRHLIQKEEEHEEG